MLISVTVILAHFGDPFWATNVVNSMIKNPIVQRIIVADQRANSIESPNWQWNQPLQHAYFNGPVDILNVEPHPVNHASLHHAKSINQMLQEFRFSTSHILLIDSDCLPTSPRALQALSELITGELDVVMAEDPKVPGQGHPCLLLMPVNAATKVDFTAGLPDSDTGRQLPALFTEMGFSVSLLPSQKMKSNRRGDLYLGGEFIHFGSMAFSARRDITSMQVRKAFTYGFPKWIVKNEYFSQYVHAAQILNLMLWFKFLTSKDFWSALRTR